MLSHTMPSVLSITNLHKSFGDHKALNGLAFEVNEGEIFGFLGLNGSGKSTTIRSVLSLIRPDSGEIRVFGKSIREHRNQVLRNIGCIIEKPDFYGYLSAYRNLMLSAGMYGIPVRKNEIYALLELVGLKGREQDAFKTFSQGMKQRLGIAQALLHDPALVILDEPTNGLDPQGIIDLRSLLLRMKDEFKKTVVVSSHILSEIEEVADSMVIIHRGKTVTHGNVRDLLSDKDLLITVETSQVEEAIRSLSGSVFEGRLLSSFNDRFILRADKEDIPELHSRLLTAGVDVFGVYSRKRLEDYFLKLTQGREAE
jgi:ABC-type multidrug transport system ATPase subunit